MDQIKASNATFIDESTGGKGKYFRARILQAGLVKYSFGVCLLEKETIDKFIYEFVGCPVIIDHKDVTEENAKNERVGVISRVWFDQMDGWFWVEGIIFDEKAISLINDGYNVSCQYEISEYANNVTDKLHNGNKYDKVILNGKPEHLAIVKNPRYENAMIAVNALDATNKDDEDIEWITVKGNHIPIKKGQSKDEAVKEFINKQQEKFSDKDKQTLDDVSSKEMSKFFQDNKITAGDLECIKTKRELPKKVQEHFGLSKEPRFSDIIDFVDNSPVELYEKSGTKKEETNTTKDTRRHLDRIEKLIKKYNLEPHEEDELIDELGSFEAKLDEGLEPREEEALREELFDFEDDIKRHQEMRKQEGKQPDGKSGKSSDGEQSDKDRIKISDLKSRKNEILKEYWEAKEGSSERERLQYDLDAVTDEIIRLEDKAKNAIIQAINEIKETDMFKNLFKKKENSMDKDELKSLFMECLSELTASNSKEEEKEEKIEEKEVEKKAENSDEKDEEEEKDKKDEKVEEKDEKEDVENKAKNEVVDKRDIIRQIMAIAGKEEASEDVKEIAKLAEKLAYDKSEADDKADNKCKAKNSIEELVGKMSMGSAEGSKIDYVSKKSAIELGNELF